MSKTAFDRLRKEYTRLLKSPVDHIEAAPLETNILEWHYVLTGPKGTPYEGGIYHGRVIFPPQYPFKPPSILMSTPNGRFKTDTRLCLSMSDFHPETWNPLWSVASILSGLLSFMLESTPTQGSVETSDHTKRELAARSYEHNLKNPTFRKLFPQHTQARPAVQAPSTPAASSAPTAAPPTVAPNVPADATLKQRRSAAPAATTAAAPASALPANSAVVGPAAAVKVPAIELLGGRIQLRENIAYDVIVLLLIVCTLIFAFLYVHLGKA